MNKFEELTNMCKEAGVSLLDACTKAGIKYGTIQKWRYKEPDAFQTESKLKETIESMKAAKVEA